MKKCETLSVCAEDKHEASGLDAGSCEVEQVEGDTAETLGEMKSGKIKRSSSRVHQSSCFSVLSFFLVPFSSFTL